MPGLLNPVTFNTEIAGGLTPRDVAAFSEQDWTYMHQWCNSSTIKPPIIITKLVPNRSQRALNRLRYFQVKAYIAQL
ncbi:Hypothetical predicted protein, partial [Pelobates cultripes]